MEVNKMDGKSGNDSELMKGCTLGSLTSHDGEIVSIFSFALFSLQLSVLNVGIPHRMWPCLSFYKIGTVDSCADASNMPNN